MEAPMVGQGAGGKPAEDPKDDVAADMSKAYDEVVGYEASPDHVLDEGTPAETGKPFSELTGKEGVIKDDDSVRSDIESAMAEVSAKDVPTADSVIDLNLQLRARELEAGNFETVDKLDQERHEINTKHVTHFATEKDDTGKPLRPELNERHPEFGQYMDAMIGHLNEQANQGKRVTLADAYKVVKAARTPQKAKGDGTIRGEFEAAGL